MNRLVAEVALVRDGADPELERRLGVIRDVEAATSARAQLDELKRTRRAALVPMALAPAAVPASARYLIDGPPRVMRWSRTGSRPLTVGGDGTGA